MTPTQQEVLITRIFDAPRDAVFRAWTDPDEVAAWYGPEQFDTPREKDPHRPAGRRALRAHDGPARGGAEYPIGYDIVELVEPELLVLRSDPIPVACTSPRSRASSSTTTATRPA